MLVVVTGSIGAAAFDVSTGAERARKVFPEPGDKWYSTVTADSKTVMSRNYAGTDFHTWSVARDGGTHGSYVPKAGSFIDASPQELNLLADDSSDQLRLVDWHVNARVARTPLKYSSEIRFSHDGTRLLRLTEDCQLTAYEVPSLTRIAHAHPPRGLSVPGATAQAFSVSRAGDRAAVLCLDGTTWLWDEAHATQMRAVYCFPEKYKSIAGRQKAIALSPDGSLLAVPVRIGEIVLLEASD
jgi:hypothetical protein